MGLAEGRHTIAFDKESECHDNLLGFVVQAEERRALGLGKGFLQVLHMRRYFSLSLPCCFAGSMFLFP